MVGQLYRLAVVAATLHFVGCAVVQPESSCCCVDPCIDETYTIHADANYADDQAVAPCDPGDGGICRHCGRGPSGPPLAHHLVHGRHHDVQPTPVEPSPTPAVWSRFHPVPTQPAFAPRPYYSPAMYGE